MIFKFGVLGLGLVGVNVLGVGVLVLSSSYFGWSWEFLSFLKIGVLPKEGLLALVGSIGKHTQSFQIIQKHSSTYLPPCVMNGISFEWWAGWFLYFFVVFWFFLFFWFVCILLILFVFFLIFCVLSWVFLMFLNDYVFFLFPVCFFCCWLSCVWSFCSF